MSTFPTTDESFDIDIKSFDILVLVDFWAEWCGPCKQIGPILEEISDEKIDKIKIVKLNIDENPITTQKYDVQGIPTLILFKRGELFDSKVGNMSKSSLNEWLDHCLIE